MRPRASLAPARGMLLACLVFAGLAAGAGPCAGAAEDERILDFMSRIQVHADAGMTITETIRVRAAGRQIRRGIYREFPTTYKDRYGNTVRVGFEVLAIERDGRPEPYHLADADNGKRIYIGQEDVFLQPGEYVYTITYHTTRQLGFFEDFDELYWNVTGNGWAFPIERASATVELPAGAHVLQSASYTGPQDARGSTATTATDAGGDIAFVTTRPLRSGEGLTIAVAWPKGFVVAPTTGQRLGFLVADNAALLAALVGLLLVSGYYLFAWHRVGRDPAPGTIIPLFSPPAGVSPAAVRFVERMAFDDKAFAAAVLDMAVKGYLTIVEDDDNVFTVAKTGNGEAALSAGERKAARRLFDGSPSLEFKNTNHRRIGAALKALRRSLSAEFEKIHFLRNFNHFLPGAGLTVGVLAALVLSAPRIPDAAFSGLWLSIWTGACYFLVTRAVKALRGGLSRGGVGALFFVLPFLGGEVMGIWLFGESVSPGAAGVFLVIVLVNAVFYHLLRAPTRKGRKLMDEIAGFRMYLETAEKERLGILHPPELTPALYEKFLPFALALDVEHEWSQQFAATLAAAGRQAEYRPGWYRGPSLARLDTSQLVGSLGGTMTGAISASSVAPGSSSGSGGGGSSGGGGGGGGGGGW